MARTRRGTRLSYRAQQQRFAKSLEFPRWITIPSILIISLMLWLGALADPSGHLGKPGIGSILYVVAVTGVAAFLAYTDRNENSSEQYRKGRPRYKRCRNATAR